MTNNEIFNWDVTYHSTEKVGLDEFDLYDIKENKTIKVTIPDMEELYMNRKDMDGDFCIQVDKKEFDKIVPHNNDIIYFIKLENLYQVISAADFGNSWTLVLNKYKVKRFLNWELN